MQKKYEISVVNGYDFGPVTVPSVIQWRLLHQVNKKWRNLSYQITFFGWSDTNT